jgi:hypothetical protein
MQQPVLYQATFLLVQDEELSWDQRIFFRNLAHTIQQPIHAPTLYTEGQRAALIGLASVWSTAFL